MKFLKKAVSALLASVMCIPSGILSFAGAAEENTVTTVTLSDTENGFMQFSEDSMQSSTASQDGYHMVQVSDDGELEQVENDGSMWAFNSGDFVEVELVPDDGYNVKSFTIKDSASGDIMASKETMDNIFSFTMPSKSVTVEAVFSNSSTVEVVPGDEIVEDDMGGGGDLDVSSRYHDITESAKISREEVEEVIFDLTTESYIKAHLDPEYVKPDGTNEPIDILTVKQTLFDGQYVQDDDTIDSIMGSLENGDEDLDESFLKFLGQIVSSVYVYDYDKDSGYYVAYANTMQKDDGYHVQDWAFAYNDNSGWLLDGCQYDSETGLLYIPKDIYKEICDKLGNEDDLPFGSLQVQFMQVYNNPIARYSNADPEEVSVPDLQSDVCTVDVNEDGSSIDVGVACADVFDLVTTTTVSPGMDPENMTVMVNGAPIPEDVYTYDPDTGNMEIGISSAAIISIEAYENDKDIKEELLDIVTDDASAGNVTYDQMNSLATIIINDEKNLPTNSKKERNWFEPFRVQGSTSYDKNAPLSSALSRYYNSYKLDGGFQTSYNRGARALADYVFGKTNSTSNIHPHTVDRGWANYIYSNLTNAKPLRAEDKWVSTTGLIEFVRKIGSLYTLCAHLGSSYSSPLTAYSSQYGCRILKIQDADIKKKVTTENGVKITTYTAKGGYIILGFVTAKQTVQTTCEMVKIKFEGQWSEREEMPDPFYLALTKSADSGLAAGGGSAFLDSTKTNGTKFRVDFYPGTDNKYKSVKTLKQEKEENGLKPKASWDFTTKLSYDKGSTKYKDYIKKMADEWKKEDNPYPVSGIDFNPKNLYNKNGFIDRDKWVNNFIDADDLDSWRQYFGKTGTYHIYEVSPSYGLTGEGHMYDLNSDGETDNVKNGLVVYMEGKIDSDKGISKILVNGKQSKGEIAAKLHVQDDTDQMDVWTAASPHKAEADSGPLRISDKIMFTPFTTLNPNNSTYGVTVSLYDTTAKEYVDVEWETPNGETVFEATEENDDDENPSYASASRLYFEVKGSDITNTFDGIEYDVYGTISTDGMEDHVLVFMVNVFCVDDSEIPEEGIDETSVTDVIKGSTAVYLSSEKDTEEQISFKKPKPGLTTTLADSKTNRKSGTGETISYAGKGQSLVDTIEYTDLPAGKTYTIKGKLVDKETNTVIKEVSEEKKTEGTKGTWKINFDIDATSLAGKKLVSLIEAYDGGDTPAFKCDSLDDNYETAIIPKIETELVDEQTKSHIMAPGKSVLIDKISYKNLIPGKYKIVSKLVNTATNAVVATSTSYENVTTESGNLTAKIECNVGGDTATVYVAYEELYIEKGKAGSNDWVLVAAHQDPNDVNQQVTTPGLKTVAMDQKTAYNISYAEKYVTLYDVVHYDNLIPNDNYILISKLVDKDTGAVVVDDNGVEQTMELTFQAKENIELGQYIDNKPYKGDLYSDLKGDLSGVINPDGTFTGKFEGNVTYVKEGRAYGDIIPGPKNHENGGVGFTLNAESFAGRTVVFFEELYHVGEHGTELILRETNLANEEQTIHFPKIWTNAIDVKTQGSTSLGGDGTTIIKDTISYENLIPGQTYRVKGYVIDRKKTLEAGKEVIATGSDGKEARNDTDYFTPDEPNGTIELTFDIDTSKYADDLEKNYNGAVFVVYEELYIVKRYAAADDELLVGTHKDISDENQTIYTPSITTELLDTKTGLHIMYAEKDASLTDTVSYYSFKPGQAYYVSGRLVDMRTGKTLVDSAGNEARIDYQQETADGSGDGTWALAYNLDASTLAGTTVVAYAEVYVKGGSEPNEDGYTPVAIHDEFFDRNERVYIPYIDTTLLDQKTDSHYALAEKDVVLYDTVHYTDIHPGDYEYKFESELRDQATGEIAVDNAGRKLSLTTLFHAGFDMRDDQFATYGDVIPQNYEGSGITFELDGEYFHDRTLVCYERMYVKGADGEWKIVADHQELLDSEQTVHIGKGWTEAADGTTKTQTGMISKNATIVDTFYYKNLNPEYTYELKRKVVEKRSTIATGTDVVVAENTVSNLRPESSSGTWHNSFTFDATKYNSEEYYGATLVVYEELYQIKRYGASDDRLLIASERDVNNAGQTVWYPHIETELLETTSGTHVMAAGEGRELTDTVSYHNMQPSTSYVLKGWLVDMESGQVLTDSAGKRMEKTVEVMSTDNGDGEWKINYSMDASSLSGKLVVAYAEVYIRNGSDTAIFSQVAQHTDFWDADERVYVPVISTVATDQKTNSHLSFAEDNMWITDRVYYSYLQADSEYRLISTLVDKETGEVVTDDKGIAQRKETTFNTAANASQEKYVQTIANPMTDSSDTGIGYAYGYVVPGDGTVLPDGKKPDGIVFSFDGGTFEGRTLVVYEELQMYNADGTWKTVATHMDPDDENQTVHIPKVRTNAIDSETMTHVSRKDGMVTIIDTVTYENLLPGMTYVIEGVLMDQLRDDEKAGMPIRDADGNMITGSVTFTPDKPDGTQRVVFQGNASNFHTDEGEFSSETLVVFEDLYLLNSKDASDDRLKVAEHRDINDENQTIYFPRVRTKAVAYGLDGNPKQGDADHVNGYAVYRCGYCRKHFLTEEEAENHINGTVLCKNKGAKAEAVTEYTLYDTLYYENLIPGRTYQVVGTVIDTATGKAVLKGHTAVQSDTKYFTPGSKSGEVDVVFHMDGPELAGGRYVVYEEIFLNGSSVASHMDINDKDQMFNVIDMKTSAKDQETGTNISAGNTVSTVIDTVEMGPLVENQEYYLKSALMDITRDAAGTKSENYGSYYRDASGGAVQGSAWRVKGTSVWHTMDEPVVGPSYDRTGGMLSVEVKFTVDTITEHGGKNFQGETYVLFEELRLAGGEVVAQHKDLADAQQTIQVGGMYTVAYDKDTGTNIMEAAEGKTLYDTVYYSNLKPSTTYKVTTRIYVKEDSSMEAGEYVEVTPLNAANLVAAAHVTSRSGTGFWTVSASMPDLSGYAGKTLVVYEDIADLDGVQVAVENNLYNESQSIHLPAASTLEADNENGLHFTRAESKWFCDNDSCVTYTCNGCGEQFHSGDEAEKHLPDCWNRESDGYTCTGGCFDTKAKAEQHTAPVYECDNCGLHFSGKEDAEAHVNGACKDAAVLRATQLVRDADGNVVNELWYACSGLDGLEFAGGRFRSFFCRKISLPHML